jgi:tetratricopeptide (TPR) repeat protein
MRWPAVVAAVAIAGPAGAQGSDRKVDAAAAYAEGQRRYGAEDYRGAAAQFVSAYELEPDPAYLFNIGQAYRLGGRCGDAARYYRKFLVEVPRAPNAGAVAVYLRDLEPCVAKEAAAEAAPPRAAEVPRAPGPRHPTARTLAFGVAGAGLATGIGFAIYVEYLEGKRDAVCDGCTWSAAVQRRADDLDRRGRRGQIAEVAGYTVGGLALAAALVLQLVDRRGAASEARADRSRSGREIAITPTRSGAAITLAF